MAIGGLGPGRGGADVNPYTGGSGYEDLGRSGNGGGANLGNTWDPPPDENAAALERWRASPAGQEAIRLEQEAAARARERDKQQAAEQKKLEAAHKAAAAAFAALPPEEQRRLLESRRQAALDKDKPQDITALSDADYLKKHGQVKPPAPRWRDYSDESRMADRKAKDMLDVARRRHIAPPDLLASTDVKTVLRGNFGLPDEQFVAQYGVPKPPPGWGAGDGPEARAERVHFGKTGQVLRYDEIRARGIDADARSASEKDWNERYGGQPRPMPALTQDEVTMYTMLGVMPPDWRPPSPTAYADIDRQAPTGLYPPGPRSAPGAPPGGAPRVVLGPSPGTPSPDAPGIPPSSDFWGKAGRMLVSKAHAQDKPVPVPDIPLVGQQANQAVMKAFNAPIFRDPLDPSGLSDGGWPSPKDIKQDSRNGGPKDCYLLAPLAGMTTTDPQGIKNAIRTVQTGEGLLGFRVRFTVPDKTDPTKTVRVEVPVTAQEVQDNIENRKGGSALDNGQAGGLWPAIIETAWARQHTPEGQSLNEGYKQIDFGKPEDVILAMTGLAPTVHPLSKILEEPAQTTFDTLQKALNEKRIVTVATHAQKYVDYAQANGNTVRLPPQHDFTITRVERDAGTGEMFVVFRDPEIDNGIEETRVPMKDFKSMAIARVVMGPSEAEVLKQRKVEIQRARRAM